MGKNYTYKLVGYDKEDKEKELKFFAPKNLRKACNLVTLV